MEHHEFRLYKIFFLVLIAPTEMFIWAQAWHALIYHKPLTLGLVLQMGVGVVFLVLGIGFAPIVEAIVDWRMRRMWKRIHQHRARTSREKEEE